MKPKILLVPISLVGCGKSTVFRAMASLCAHVAHLENDTCPLKAEYYKAVDAALQDPHIECVLLDRNNHLPLHRKEIMARYRHVPGLRIVALLFVPQNVGAKHMYKALLDRISQRGDNHPQVKSSTDFGKARMILGSFVKSFVNYNVHDAADAQFDAAVDMAWGPEASRANVATIMALLGRLPVTLADGSRGMPLESQMDAALARSMRFVVGETRRG